MTEIQFLEVLRPMLDKKSPEAGAEWVANEAALARLATELTTRFAANELYDMLKQLGPTIEGIRQMPGGSKAAEQVMLCLFVPITQAVVRSARGEVVARQQKRAEKKKPDGLAPATAKGVGLRR